MIGATPDRRQFVIDLGFGAALVAPIAYTAVTGDLRGTYMAVGISVGYVLHVSQKMLMYQEMLQEAVKEEAQERVKKEAKERVEKEAEEKVEEKVENVS